MPEPTPFNLSEAQLADGTIDFYAMLGEAPGADTDTLRARITALYAEAQANRDHRNLTRRKEFQVLLELLPDARNVLLDGAKRPRYDAYLAQSKAGSASPDFETFMNDLMGVDEPMEAKTGLLGVSENTEVRARVIKAPPETPAKTRPIPSRSAPVAPSAGLPMLAVGGGVVGLILGFIVGNLLFHSTIPALLVAIMIGAVLFVLLNRKTPGGKIGV